MGRVLPVTWTGLRGAFARPGLVTLVWACHLVVAAVAVYPLWRTLADTLAPLPEGDVLGAGIPLGALADLAELRPGLIGSFGEAALAVAALGVLMGAAVSGGVIEVLRSRDQRSLGHRFGRGAGRFFVRFLGVGLMVGILGGVAGALVLGPFVAMARASFRASGEPGALPVLGGALGAAGVALVTLIVLDVARILVVRDDGTALQGVRAALGLVLRRPHVWAGTWLSNAVLVSVALGLYVLARDLLPSAAPLVALVLTHQALILARIGLRVSLLASESALADALAGGPAVPTSESPSPPTEQSLPGNLPSRSEERASSE